MAAWLVNTVVVLFLTYTVFESFQLTAEVYCPNNGKAASGKWRLDNKDGWRCILDCDTGYSPSGCHIIGKDGYGNWNYNISTCEEDSWLHNKQMTCFAAVSGAVAASPLLLKSLGFTSIGIAGGSIAAKWMAYIGIVSKGSWFAWLQSLGMTGISKAAWTKLTLIIGGACDGLTDIFSEHPCEQE